MGSAQSSRRKLLASTSRIVRRIDIRDCERPLSMNLDDSVARCPGVVIHLCRCFGISACGQLHSLLFVELVTHSDVKIVVQDREVLSRWVVMGRNSVAPRRLYLH